MYESFGVPGEIEQGIASLLLTATFPEGPTSPFAVLTRDQSLWLGRLHVAGATLLDVSPLFPLEVRFVTSRAEYEVERKIFAAGWKAYKKQYRLRSEIGGVSIFDYVLLDQEGKPLAVV